MTSPSEFTNFWISNFQLLQFSNLLEVVVIQRKNCRDGSRKVIFFSRYSSQVQFFSVSLHKRRTFRTTKLLSIFTERDAIKSESLHRNYRLSLFSIVGPPPAPHTVCKYSLWQKTSTIFKILIIFFSACRNWKIGLSWLSSASQSG